MAVPKDINYRIHQTIQQSKHDGTFLRQNYNLSVEQFKHNSTNFRTFQRINFKPGKTSGLAWQSCCLVKTLLKAAIEYKTLYTILWQNMHGNLLASAEMVPDLVLGLTYLDLEKFGSLEIWSQNENYCMASGIISALASFLKYGFLRTYIHISLRIRLLLVDHFQSSKYGGLLTAST